MNTTESSEPKTDEPQPIEIIGQMGAVNLPCAVLKCSCGQVGQILLMDPTVAKSYADGNPIKQKCGKCGVLMNVRLSRLVPQSKLIPPQPGLNRHARRHLAVVKS